MHVCWANDFRSSIYWLKKQFLQIKQILSVFFGAVICHHQACLLRRQRPWKRRFVTYFRLLNQDVYSSRFKLDHWGVVFPHLKRGAFACKVELKYAYFHFPLSKHLSRHVCVWINGKVYAFQGMPSGSNIAPDAFMSFMKGFTKVWRCQGLMVFIYMDDVRACFRFFLHVVCWCEEIGAPFLALMRGNRCSVPCSKPALPFTMTKVFLSPPMCVIF